MRMLPARKEDGTFNKAKQLRHNTVQHNTDSVHKTGWQAFTRDDRLEHSPDVVCLYHKQAPQYRYLNTRGEGLSLDQNYHAILFST